MNRDSSLIQRSQAATAARREGSTACTAGNIALEFLVTDPRDILHWPTHAAVRGAITTAALRGMGLAGSVGLGAKVGGSRARLREVAGEDRLKERAEDDLGAARSC